MPIQKQAFPINFAQGLDRKTDPLQVGPGKFSALTNTIFDQGGALTKRNGYGVLTALPDKTSTLAATFNGNLVAIGQRLRAYSQSTRTTVDKGSIQPVKLGTTSIYRSSTNQSQVDSAVSSNGLVCTVFTDSSPAAYKYVVSDAVTGQSLVAPATLPANTAPRVFVLGSNFIIVFGRTGNLLSYISVNTSTLKVNATPMDLSTQFLSSTTGSFDGAVANNFLYLSFNGTDTGGAIRTTYLDTSLVQHNTLVTASYVATLISVCADTTGNTPVIWTSFYNSATSVGYTMAVNPVLTSVVSPTQFLSGGAAVLNLTSTAANSSNTVYFEQDGAYSYDATLKTHTISTAVCQIGTGALVGMTAPAIYARGVGLASKAFILSGRAYVLTAFQGVYQPSYFLLDDQGAVVAKLAYSNGAGYASGYLPSVTLAGVKAQLSYLVKDFIQSVNKTQGLANAAGIYSQLGINLASFTFASSAVSTAELGQNLLIGGGFLWAYDGAKPVEQNFHLWPEGIEATFSTTGGSMKAQPDGATNASAYFYQVVYEWSDNQGNIQRSAPSVPLAVTTTGTTATCSVTLNIPTLRLTYKTGVRIVVYRWSVAQQSYYALQTPATPLLNDPTVDSVQYVDTQADSSILGNALIYTTGGVVENIGAGATTALTVFQSRVVQINDEDPYTLSFSKQVVEASPVEMSDLFTIYVAPSVIGREPSGPCRTIAVMDDKLIIGRRGSFCYITGIGPDSTGAQNDFSNPTFITGAVGCENQSSFAMIPEGLMFQAASGKGIWLLGRDLSCSYIGAAVEAYNNQTITSAASIPGTNRIQFTLSGGGQLVYDYFFKQWSTFDTPAALSSCLVNNLHTFIDSYGRVFQETPGLYLDGPTPVLIGFTTGWYNLAGLQGFERAYEMQLLGTWVSPHKLQLSIAYDYNPGPSQSVSITPDNTYGSWGGLALWGSSGSWGGSPLENWRIFFNQQKVTSFQITLQEVYDPSYGLPAGQGVILSGLNIVAGLKKGYSTRPAKNSAG